LIQAVPNSGWAAMQDVLQVLPGPFLEFNQLLQPEELKDAGMQCGTICIYVAASYPVVSSS
jgi:hypothetical protein